MPDVIIVVARCAKSQQSYGIRIEEKQPGVWLADWAFTLSEASAQRQGYGQGKVSSGSFSTDDAYPGCPHCRSASFFQCSCGKVACWDGQQKHVTCPWCKRHATLSGTMRSVQSGGDR
jgi:hypothetical protein